MSILTRHKTQRITVSQPRALLHIEGAALLLGAAALYAQLDLNWWSFALFLLAPDLAAVFYAVSPRAGSTAYNLVHTTALPLALAVLSATSGNTAGEQAALIWLAHIGMDRLFGYGFKYPDNFKNTHFSRI